MTRNKSSKEADVVAAGQLSIWDSEIIKKPNVVKKIIIEILPEENEKFINPFELTDMQHEFLKNKAVMENDNLSRIIKYCSGWLGIEFKYDNEYHTLYINKVGNEEFESNKKSAVLPMDVILYYKEEFKINEIQDDNLKGILEDGKSKIKRVIHRKGDENILIELEDKVVSLKPNGWKLDFNIYQVECKDYEVLNFKLKETDIKEIQLNIKGGYS